MAENINKTIFGQHFQIEREKYKNLLTATETETLSKQSTRMQTRHQEPLQACTPPNKHEG